VPPGNNPPIYFPQRRAQPIRDGKGRDMLDSCTLGETAAGIVGALVGGFRAEEFCGGGGEGEGEA